MNNSFFKIIREDLHRIPEACLQEFETAKYIRNFLKNNSIEFLEIGTSTIVEFKGKEDIWIGIRADIDGLPMKEENEVEYKSTNEGYMHACGHDGHTTILLSVAKDIKEYLNNGGKLKKSVFLIFQAGEENAGEAENLAKHEFYTSKNIEGIFALHLDPELEQGKIGATSGAMSYQGVYIEIEVTGKGCHGAQSFKGIDSILVSAKLLEAYQSIVSRNVKTEEPLIISIGSFHGGTRGNIIPEKVKMTGTIRVVNKDLIPFVKKRIDDINEGFEKAFGVKINLLFESGYPAIFNSKILFDRLTSAANNGTIELVDGIRLMGSEDFSYYTTEHVKGLFFMLGVKNEEKGYLHPLHSTKFDFDPHALEVGNKIFINILKEMEVL